MLIQGAALFNITARSLQTINWKVPSIKR